MMNRHLSIVCSVVFALLLALPSQILAASITETRAAIGEGCQATGENSTAMGYQTTAGGTASIAMGCFTTAGGRNSFAGGQYMQLSGAAENTFVWGCSDSPQSISTPNVFLIFPTRTAGSVGIGTPDPGQKLDIHGEAGAMVLSRLNQVGTDNWFGWRFDRDAVEKWFIGMGPGDQNLLFRRTASSNDMVITEAGRVGIGRTPANYALEVQGEAGKTTGNGSWQILSDARLKDLTGKYTRGLDAIAGLRPVTFFYKQGNPLGLSTDEEYVGFIAQEVQEIFPEAVSERKDGYLDFNMHPVGVAMVNAIKELKAQNEALRAENMALREDIQQIKAALGL